MTDDLQISNEQILFQNHPIVFFKKTPGKADEYFTPKDITVEKTDCGWQFQIPAKSSPDVLGIMIPAYSLEVMIDNSPLDLYKSKQFYYSPSKELERIFNLNPHDLNDLKRPIVHMSNQDKAFAWSCPNECLISSFVYQYQWYINFKAVVWEDHMTFFLDQSTNYLVNLQRYSYQDEEVLINETTSLKTMQKALLTGTKPRSHPNHPHALIREARQVQLELQKRHLDSVIIGSLARRLNSVPVDVNDIDLMVRNKDQLHFAIDVLESFADRLSLHDMHAKFQHQDCTIDICYDNYNIMHSASYVSKHGLVYLETEGLLWLYMINLFACEMDEHSDDYKDHVTNAIVSLHRTHKLGEFDLIPYGADIQNHSKKCFDLCQQLFEAKIEYRDIRINKPFLVRPYRKEDEFFYVIVNLGSCCDAEVVIDQIPDSAIWEDISGTKKTINLVPHDTFSIACIPQISLPGILRCQRSQ